MQRSDLEEDDLDAAFKKLSQLEEICFGPGDFYPSGAVASITPGHLSSLGRDTSVEPAHRQGILLHDGKFTAMMAAAYKNKKEIKVVKALDLA